MRFSFPKSNRPLPTGYFLCSELMAHIINAAGKSPKKVARGLFPDLMPSMPHLSTLRFWVEEFSRIIHPRTSEHQNRER
jgi:hypothetical protein